MRVKYLLIFAIVLLAFNYKPADETINLKLRATSHEFYMQDSKMDFQLETVAGWEQLYVNGSASVTLRLDTASRFFKAGFCQMQDDYYIAIYHVKK